MTTERQPCAVCGHGPEAHTGGGEMLHDFRTDQPTLRDELAKALYGLMGHTRPWAELEGWRQEKWVGDADALLPVIEADRERAVANALAARVLRDLDYATEPPTEETA